jgi:hypothetical protein
VRSEASEGHVCISMAVDTTLLLYFSRDCAKSVLRIHFMPHFQTVVSPSILGRFA